MPLSQEAHDSIRDLKEYLGHQVRYVQAFRYAEQALASIDSLSVLATQVEREKSELEKHLAAMAIKRESVDAELASLAAKRDELRAEVEIVAKLIEKAEQEHESRMRGYEQAEFEAKARVDQLKQQWSALVNSIK
jgi:septal ring factor EnvC (AmiA/AmiB activator)